MNAEDARLALIRSRLIELGAGVPATVGALVRRAADLTTVPKEAIVGPGRTADVVWIRHAIALVASEPKETGGRYRVSLSAIGRALGNRDHSSMLNAIERAGQRERQGEDEAFSALCAMLREHRRELERVAADADQA